MTHGISLEELLAWNDEASAFWKTHLEANPGLLQLPCDIGGTANVQEFVRHIWGVELRWSQRIAGQPAITREEMPAGPLDALFEMHTKANTIVRKLLEDRNHNWNDVVELDLPWLPAHLRKASRRKLMAHMLFHSQRHWAQLATLVRSAGFPSGFYGDILFSTGMQQESGTHMN
jgi:uncharacterized damage-inducible protein DinB